jgi:aryl-phospho-beta-D-glucosidase BglC (GH1 family)
MRLTGVNLGGFYSQVKDDKFLDEHLDTFITADDLKRIRNWGFNSVRLPVDHFFFETSPFRYDESRLARIDATASRAEKAGLKLVLDLHKAPGHSFDFKERFTNDIWDTKSENRKRFLAIWEMLGKRYSTRENMIFELLNEPVAPDASDCNVLYGEAIGAIRSRDRNHEIMLESNLWGTCSQFANLKKFDDTKIIYSFHFYEPVLITHQFAPWMSYVVHDIYKKAVKYPGRPEGLQGVIDKIGEKDDRMAEVLRENDKYWDINGLEKLFKPVLDFKEKYNVPLYCGEFGAVVLADKETRVNWTNDLMTLIKKYGISFAYWSYKNMDFGVIDDTEQYKDNPSYGADRVDHGILKALQGSI